MEASAGPFQVAPTFEGGYFPPRKRQLMMMIMVYTTTGIDQSS